MVREGKECELGQTWKRTCCTRHWQSARTMNPLILSTCVVQAYTFWRHADAHGRALHVKTALAKDAK
eukprot:3790765-Amphidinium_carterae.1